MQARANRTAREMYHERAGVCRDYMHLAITFCRCMNIPARYCTGYLGDIGVPLQPYPMDFSAWFEAYLGGQWYAFDARNNMPRIGRVLMARGRDAADVALTTTFGMNTLQSFKVWTDEVGCQPLRLVTAAVGFTSNAVQSVSWIDQFAIRILVYCIDVSPFCFSIDFADVRVGFIMCGRAIPWQLKVDATRAASRMSMVGDWLRLTTTASRTSRNRCRRHSGPPV